ncbi:hypothetical protein B0H14DRAFT_699742 [Mycena olivaceomarginata]|nr:hypothetical protein B0H14DRAFT_699742 [Mycena olivaceomarginata]
MSLPVLLRTYNTPDYPAMDCTIWQAGRATSAAPTFFKQIRIGRPGLEEAFLDGGWATTIQQLLCYWRPRFCFLTSRLHVSSALALGSLTPSIFPNHLC